MESLPRYNPACMDIPLLDEILVGRETVFDEIRKAFAGTANLIHLMITGPTGIGKTHILRLIFHAVRGDIIINGISEYGTDFIPVCLAEEEYIDGITDFVILILRHLDDLGMRFFNPEPDSGSAGFRHTVSILEGFREKTGKTLLLFIDNFNELVDALDEPDRDALARLLREPDNIRLISGGVIPFNKASDPTAAFYPIIGTIMLNELSLAESVELLKRCCQLFGGRDIAGLLSGSSDNLRVVYEVIGGRPRMLLSLFETILRRKRFDIDGIVTELLDKETPRFTSMMKEFSQQQRKIIETMASSVTLLTPTQIASLCRLHVNIVNSQLKRLDNLGYISKAAAAGRKMVYYDISERMFRIWREMRINPRGYPSRYIIKFLSAWHSNDKLSIRPERMGYKLIPTVSFIEPDCMNSLQYFTEEPSTKIRKDDICLACSKDDKEAVVGILQSVDDNYRKELQGRNCYYVKDCEEPFAVWLEGPIVCTELQGLIDTGRELKGSNRNAALSWFKCGRIYQDFKSYDKAVDAFRRSLELNPEWFKAWNNLGEVYLEMGRTDDAIGCFKRSIALNHGWAVPWDNLGRVYTSLKRTDEAIDTFKQSVMLEPGNIYGWIALGRLYTGLSQYDLALASFKRAAAIEPKNYFIWIMIGNVYASLRRFEEAADAYKKSIEIMPRQIEAWNNLGNVLASLNAYDAAVSAYKESVSENPLQFMAWFNLGNVCFIRKMYDEAVNWYLKSLSSMPSVSLAHSNLGDCYTRLGMYAEAVGEYRRSLEIKADRFETWLNKGAAHFYLERYDESISCFKRSIELSPLRYITWKNLGAAYERDAMYDYAIDAYKEALRLDTTDQNIWNSLGWTYCISRHYAESAEAYKNSLSIDKTQGEIWNNYGCTFIMLNDLNGATNSFSQSLALNPDKVTPYKNLAFCRYLAKDYEVAIAALQEVIRLMPDDAESQRHLITTYLSYFETEVQRDNIGNGLVWLRESIGMSQKTGTEGFCLPYIVVFRNLIKQDKTAALSMAILEIERIAPVGLVKTLRPFKTFIELRDNDVLDMLRYEERRIVEEMISLSKEIRDDQTIAAA